MKMLFQFQDQGRKKTVLELYVSFHGNDEFWYSNPLNSYITTNGLDTERGNGAYREVCVTICAPVLREKKKKMSKKGEEEKMNSMKMKKDEGIFVHSHAILLI
ncbi:peptide N-acetyl-beta-D-glucosaminyl asparaginase amidase A [Medicago truncatula]|uniref:Peptide N-acetyl-beta-D-glucosaminyl asparaginase amidase A n=1 Tax=Medicago truncatula TaxID=3880 RepID=A0A072V4W3_MEDTR|nr:peptide N-acetyl-beta-D-glucosaminyl asparaginase amidase A [Medicago truncatula]